MSFAEKIKGMGVVWFSFNVATSAIVLGGYALGNAAGIRWLVRFSDHLALLNTAIFIVIATLFLLKVVLAWETVKRMFYHPVQAPFMSVLSISIMLLSLDWGVVRGDPSVGFWFFVAGTVLHTLIFATISYVFFMHTEIEVHTVNPGWYMPPVGNVLVPYIGGFLREAGYNIPQSLLGIYLGSGVILWIAFATIWIYRTIFHHPPHARLLGTLWINLAPPSIVPMAYESMFGLSPRGFHVMASQLSHVTPLLAKELSLLYGIVYYTFWGSAGVFLLIVLLITAGYLARGEVEFAESWWAFVFPVAAYTISTIHLYLHFPDEHWLLYYAGALYALAWTFYTVTTIFSLYYAVMELKGKTVEQLPEPAKPLAQ